ncbi:contact-dependent growth inhibition system immunity protein [Aquimarina sp. RZ0]|uniref:contact-dependent growth inhibition system immunity protein n=1 Tax=Aquimarina sp. RZ0 TaxID=2607730 RepID=UPI0011F3652C|nr:contact-dependent growth inhibition system immunity protein [Aquimarina sp. RZ0]KAA1247715.1 hypothetical protein F0000_02600 [Aquimarina sp. RZ0]
MLEEKYPYLFQFFTGYFPESDLDQLTDYEVVQKYLKENSETVLTKTKKELQELLNDGDIWKEIGIEINRYFGNDKEIKAWLEMVSSQFDNWQIHL